MENPALVRHYLERYARILAPDFNRSRSVWLSRGDNIRSTVYNDFLFVVTGWLEFDTPSEAEATLKHLAGLRCPILLAIPTFYSASLDQAGVNAHKSVIPPEDWEAMVREVFPDAVALAFAERSVAIFVTQRPSVQASRRLKFIATRLALMTRMKRSLGGRARLLIHARRCFVSTADLLASLEGKRVAVVGNARSLANAGYGEQIDRADIVIRFNAAPILSVQSHGLRTDWLATGIDVPANFVRDRGVSLVLWMFKKRRMPAWMFSFDHVHLFCWSKLVELEREIGSRPTTGYMIIDLLRQSSCQSADLYGFDFFASLSSSGNRARSEVPHDFDAERDRITALIDSDPRFRLHQAPQAEGLS